MLALSIDVTERKRADEARRASEERFQVLFENMLNGFAYCRMDFDQGNPQDFTYLAVNNAFETLTGLKNVVGRKVSDVIPGIRETDPELFAIYGRVASTGIPERFEMLIEALDMWFLISVYSPQQGYFVAVFDVITERKRAEQALRAQAQQLSSIYDTVGDVIFYLVVEGKDDYRFASVNQSFLTTTGLEFDQVVGKHVTEVTPPSALALVLERYGEAIREKRVVRWEETSQYPSGTLTGEVSVAPVFNEAGVCTHLVGAVHDVSERKKAEMEIRRLNAELEQRVVERTAQLEAKTHELETFTYSVSHDLKAPLRGIAGYSRLLLEDHTDQLNDEGRTFLENIRRATEQMSQLIDDLLSYSRLERRDLQVRPVNLQAIVQALVAEYAGVAQARGVSIAVDVPPTAPHTDPEGVSMSLRNLIDNAFKFTRDTANPRIEITGRETEKSCIIMVRDNGIGFHMQYHDRIFEIFQRLHPSEDYDGTGVGLAIVRKAVERMGGRIWAESELGHGATFYLEIPR